MLKSYMLIQWQHKTKALLVEWKINWMFVAGVSLSEGFQVVGQVEIFDMEICSVYRQKSRSAVFAKRQGKCR